MARLALVARFILDSKGAPKVAYQGDAPHYGITLTVSGAPEDAYAVTYQLHESYYEPVRESRRGTDDFAEEITSYGDYEVRATVRGKSRTQMVVAELSEALARGHAKETSPAIATALASIRAH
jgi:hypothetical protein